MIETDEIISYISFVPIVPENNKLLIIIVFNRTYIDARYSVTAHGDLV